MTSSGTLRDNLTWMGTIAIGGWLSVRLARWMAASLASEAPVREIVEEVLTGHRDEDRPMVHAFEEALENEVEEGSRG